MKKNLIIIAMLITGLTSAYSLTLKEKLEAYTGKVIYLHVKDGEHTEVTYSPTVEITREIMFYGTLSEVGDGYIVLLGKRQLFKYGGVGTTDGNHTLEYVNKPFIIPMDQIVYFEADTNLP